MRDDNYPTVLLIVAGVPWAIAWIIVFASVADGNGEFDTTEMIVFGTGIVGIILLFFLDMFRWERWKERNR